MRFFSSLSLVWFAVAGLLSGCQTLNRVFSKSNANTRAGITRAIKLSDAQGTMFWSHFDATKRSSIINANPDGTTTVLAEVTPDAALQKSLEALAKAKAIDKVDAEAQLKTASTIAQLGQRTANVNMLRDALYRIAEGANNKPDAFYTCGCPTGTAPSGVNSTKSTSDSTTSKTTTTTSKSNTTTSTTNTTAGKTITTTATPGAATSGSTMYERLFQATLTTYAAAVNAEAGAEKAKAEAEKAKAELEKAKLEAAKPKDKSAADVVASTKPATPSDSTATEVSIKLEMLAKKAPVAKKEKAEKKPAKK